MTDAACEDVARHPALVGDLSQVRRPAGGVDEVSEGDELPRGRDLHGAFLIMALASGPTEDVLPFVLEDTAAFDLRQVEQQPQRAIAPPRDAPRAAGQGPRVPDSPLGEVKA